MNEHRLHKHLTALAEHHKRTREHHHKRATELATERDSVDTGTDAPDAGRVEGHSTSGSDHGPS